MAAVVVSYDQPPETLRSAIDSLLAQTRPPDEIRVVVNRAETTLPPLADVPGLELVSPPENLGYSNAVNAVAAAADADYLFTLNPDASAEPDCLERLLAVAESDASVALVGAQVLSPDGATTQGGDNPLHPSGISPAGAFGRPRERGAPRDVLVVAGTSCLIRRSAFLELGSFTDAFFLYYEDADLAWRARIAGRRVVFCPDAGVRHAYEFGRRERKLFLLERNRLIAVLSNYEARSLLVLAPLLLLTELGVLALAALEGWLPEKLRAYASVWALRRTVAAHRRRVQSLRTRGDRELLPLFSARLDSPFIPRPAARLATAVTSAYLRLV